MNKTELESKHLGELHSLAAEAGVERYRMLPRAELIEKLAGGASGAEAKPKSERSGGSQRRPRGGREEKPRGGRQRKPRAPREEKPRESRPERRREPKREPEPKPEPSIAPATTPSATTPPPSGRPKRKRRRRWGRRGPKSVRIQDLLLPAAAGRQAIVYAETREGCTALLRDLAAELSGGSNGGPDPIALLIDPTPEELAEWRRDAPQAEIVAAGQARHADDALAQAARRAGSGEDVIVLVDSLSRFAESYGDVDGAKQLFDAGREAATGSGTLTVVAAVERSS